MRSFFKPSSNRQGRILASLVSVPSAAPKRVGGRQTLVFLTSFLWFCGLASAEAEYRALWIDTWNPGILDDEQTRLTVARARNHHFNTLFVEVSKTMDAYYDSDLLPRATNIQPGFDPLAASLRYARSAEGKTTPLEVHAWIVALRCWKDKPLPSTSLNPPHVMRKHPDWISKNYRGARFDDSNYFLDPGHPGVQDFVCGIAREIVKKYPVDGLHLDYIRYPGQDWGYNEVALKRFQEEMGRKDIPKPDDADWSAWRRQQVNNLVRRISAEIHEIRPQVELSAATITWGDVPGGDFTKTRAYIDALQNWVGWMEAGYLDIAVPMVYKRSRDALQARDYVDWVKLGNSVKSNRHFISGLGAWFNPLSDTARQIEVARRHGSEGVCFFSYNQLENTDRTSPYVLRDISGSIFKSPAPIPRADWLERPTSGTLAGVDPKRRGGYPVLLLDKDGKNRGEIRTDANGHFAFFGLPPGTWRAQVGRASILSEPVRIERGRVSRARFR